MKKTSKKRGMQRATEIAIEIYTDLYKNSEPPLDYMKLIGSSEEVMKKFNYDDHYLPQEEFDRIVNKHISKSRLPQWYKNRILFEVYLGHSPTSYKKQ